jgi:uncharacterized protein (DUF1800 family)
MRVLALLVFSMLLADSSGWALTMRITPNNFAQFRNVAAHPSWVCYTSVAEITRLGTLSDLGTKIARGRTWSSASNASLAARKRALIQSLKGRRLSAEKRRAARKEVSKIDGLLRVITAALSQCANDATRSDEFLGRPQSLVPYRERLTDREVRHLLDKVAFGGNAELRRIGLQEGLTPLVDALLSESRFGERVTATEQAARFWEDQARFSSDEYSGLKVWTTAAITNGALYRMIYSPTPLKEWMTQLWATHFAVNIDRIGFSYNSFAHLGLPAHVALFRDYGTVNFRAMAHGVITDSAMAAWLNNDDNRADSPNQNFAREFLELFTLGTVDPVTLAPNYGEESVEAATAYMSGFNEDAELIEPYGNYSRVVNYSADQHDATPRTVFPGISGAATNATFSPHGFADYVLDHHPGAARYIGAKLFAQMVNPEVSADVTANLAASLVQDGFALNGTLEKILKSEAMFSTESRAVCLRSPLDSLVRLLRSLNMPEISRIGTVDDLESRSWFLGALAGEAGAMGQAIFQPPSVFGWKDACGVNRAGRVARGDGWLADQTSLNRGRGCIAAMNLAAGVLDYDFAKWLLPNEPLDWESVALIIARGQGVSLSETQRAAVTRFLGTEITDQSGRRRSVSLGRASNGYFARKLPRAVCLINGLPQAQMR